MVAVAVESTPSVNPATGEEYAQVPLHSPEQLRAAVARSREAQVTWAATPVHKRAAALRKIRDHIVTHAREISEIISRDNGKTIADAIIAEVAPAAMSTEYYAANGPRFLRPHTLATGNWALSFKRSRIHRTPFGVVGIMSPWNYPFSIPFAEVVMALMAGNGVILKVASDTLQVGLALERCIEAGGLPPGLFEHVNMPGRVAGDAFLESGIDKLFFTGSVPVGKKLMAKASETLTPVSLELGGNDAMIVCADANLDRAANGAAWGGFQNCGQSCGGVERIYVERPVYERFVEKLAKRVRRFRIGQDGPGKTVDLGAMTVQRQVELVKRHISGAVDAGATIYAQSEVPDDPSGFFHPAVILTDVDHTMEVMRDETFGPVVGVMPFDDIDEAVGLANDSNLGLTASVWTRSRAKGERIARRVRAGAVMVNDHLMSHGLAETPWGGFKESGIGRTHGALGFDEMTQPQVIVHDMLPLKKQLWWHPHGPASVDGIEGMLGMLYGPGVGARVRGLVSTTRLLFRTLFG